MVSSAILLFVVGFAVAHLGEGMVWRNRPLGCYFDCGPYLYKQGLCECDCPRLVRINCPADQVEVCGVNRFNCPLCRCNRRPTARDDLTLPTEPATTRRPSTTVDPRPRPEPPVGCAKDCGPYRYAPVGCSCVCPMIDVLICPPGEKMRCALDSYGCAVCRCEVKSPPPPPSQNDELTTVAGPRRTAPEGCELDCGPYMYYPNRCECMCPQMDMMVCPEGEVQRCDMNEYGCPSCSCEPEVVAPAYDGANRTAPVGCDLNCGPYMYYPNRCECMCPQMDMMVCPEGQVQRCEMNEYGCPSCTCVPEIVANSRDPIRPTSRIPAGAPRRTAPVGCDLDCGSYMYYRDRCECMCPQMDMMVCPEGQVQRCEMNVYGCPSCSCGHEEPEITAPPRDPIQPTSSIPAEAPRRTAPEGCDLDCGSYMYYRDRCECMCPPMDMMACREGQVQRCEKNDYGCSSCSCESEPKPSSTTTETPSISDCPAHDELVCQRRYVTKCDSDIFGCPVCSCQPAPPVENQADEDRDLAQAEADDFEFSFGIRILP